MATRPTELPLVFPTIKTLETLLPFSNAEQVLGAAPERSMDPVLPRVAGTRENHRILLPWEEGYADAAPEPGGLESER